VSVVVYALQERLHRGVVPGLRGADEVVVGDVQQLPGVTEALGRAVRHLLGADAVGLGRPLDLEPMLVGAGQEEGVVAQQAVPAGEGIGDDGGVGVSDVRCVVDVVDRGRHVIAGHVTRLLAVVTDPTVISPGGDGLARVAPPPQ
jgi:hypothetical protein